MTADEVSKACVWFTNFGEKPLSPQKNHFLKGSQKVP